MSVTIINRQRTRKIKSRRLREIVEELFAQLEISRADLGINLVGAREMARVNRQFLQHEGSTDVITFDHTESGKANRRMAEIIHGELFVCVDVAVIQAKEFDSSWQGEITRYIVHGVLHLLGHDDLKPGPRRKMKREENRLMRLLSKRFSLAQLAGPVRLPA